MITDPTPDSASIVSSTESENLPTKDDSVKRETRALIDAIKKRAQAEVKAIGNVSRDTYLDAVRRAKESVETHKIVERDRVDDSVRHIQQEAEKNWHTVAEEIESLGSRLAEAAKAAWDKLTERREK